MGNADFEGAILDSGNYEGKINHIGIAHERTRHPDAALAEEEHVILRSELGELMRIARIARPCAIYDASAAAQTSTCGEMFDVSEGEVLGNGEMQIRRENGRTILSTYRFFFIILQGKQKNVNKANLLKIRKSAHRKRILRYKFLFSKKGDS